MHPPSLTLPLLLVLAVPVLAATPDGGVPAKPAEASKPVGPLKTDNDKALYTLGVGFGKNLELFDLSKAETEIVKRGVTDGLTGAKPLVSMEEYGPKIGQLANERRPKSVEKRRAKDKHVLDAAAKEKGAQVLPSGVIFIPSMEGKGAQPKPTDTVKVNYKGTLADGAVFDSSYKRGQPAEFPLGNVIPCWTEGVSKMKVGGKAKLVCPDKAGYGERGAPGGGIPGGAVLTFEVELLDVKPPAPTPTTPGPAPSPK